MKKIILLLVGALAAAMFATDASAIPAFARQTGMACSACHYQHFPALTSFGRSFKENGYTMTGAQEKIEGDGVSLPVVLNAALVGYVGYTKTNGPTDASTPTSKSNNDGQLGIPQQVSLFMGGRAGEHIGFETEINVANAGVGTGQAGMIRLKIPFVFDVGSVKAGVIPFSTQNLGVADSFEVMNTGAVAVHAFNQTDMSAVSAQQFINTAMPAHGVAFIASNDDFFANFAKWGASEGNGTAGGPTSNYLRAAWTTGTLIPGFDSAVGFQVWSGTSTATSTGSYNKVNGYNGSGFAGIQEAAYFNAIAPGAPFTAIPAGTYDTKASAIDAQTMGDVAGMPLLVVASYAKAPTNGIYNAITTPNLFNLGSQDRKSFNIGAELGVIPNKATLQFAIRRASSGMNQVNAAGTGLNAGTNASDNAVMIGATYAIALNARLELTMSKYSGDQYGDNVKAFAAANGLTYVGDSLTAVDLAFGF